MEDPYKAMKKVVLSIFLITLAVFSGACGSSGTPEAVVEQYLTALRELDFDRAGQYLAAEAASSLDDYLSTFDEAPELEATLFRSLKFTVDPAEINETDAAVTLSLAVCDLEIALQNTLAAAFGLVFSMEDAAPEEIELVIENRLIAEVKAAPLVTRPAEVRLKKTGDTWLITDVEAIITAISGTDLAALDEL
jgi:hypothetical protein